MRDKMAREILKQNLSTAPATNKANRICIAKARNSAPLFIPFEVGKSSLRSERAVFQIVASLQLSRLRDTRLATQRPG
jgi:hypothetical protein